MKNIVYTILLLMLSVSSAFAQINGSVSFGFSDLSFSKVNGYDIIRLKNQTDLTQTPGSPELPVVTKTYVLPKGVTVTGLNINVIKSSEISGTFMPYPVQPPIEIGSSESEFLKPDSATYYGTTPYPTKDGEIISDYNEMGYHLVSIRLYPVMFSPQGHKLYLRDISFSLSYENSNTPESTPTQRSEHRGNIVRKMVKSMVENPDDVDKFYHSKLQSKLSADKNTGNFMEINTISEQVPDYIIITNKTLKSEFQKLADWKTQKGIPAIIKDIESINAEYIGSDLPEKIHEYLKECYNKWGAGLFVLIGGDTNIVPSRFYHDKNGAHPSDIYYADLECDWNANKNHLYAEENKDDSDIKNEYKCFIGRAPAKNIEEADLFVKKVLSYEKIAPSKINTNYLMNHLAATAYLTKSNTLSDSFKSEIFDFLSPYPQLNKWFLFDHYNCNCSLHSDHKMFSNGEELNRYNFLQALNGSGNSNLGYFHIIYHQDHSSYLTLGTSSLDKHEVVTITDIDNINTGNYYQIVLTNGCSPVHFDLDCIAEHFINNIKGGAVAIMGNANSGYKYNYDIYKSFLSSLYKDRNKELGLLLKLIVSKTTFLKKDVFKRFHLLGDPEMPVWSAVPQELNVSVSPTVINAGENEITVQINNLPSGKEAMVCLMKDNEAYSSIVIKDNQKHTFRFTPKTSGTMKVTITAHNFIPFEKLINVTVNNGNLISIKGIYDFNGSMTIGAKDSLRIMLKNNGKITANNVIARLSTSSPYIQITKNDVVYGTINPKEEKHGNSAFGITVKDNAPETMRNEWNGTCFYLTIRKDDTAIADIDTFRVDLVSPRLRIERMAIKSTTNGNLIPEAGENISVSVKYTQLGSSSTKSPRLKIIPTTNYIEYVKQDGIVSPSFGNISIAEKNSLSYSFKISSSYEKGKPLTMAVVLKNGNITQDSIIFNAAETVPNIESDKIYHDFNNNSISFYWDNMTGATKYNIYRSSTINGVYNKQNKLPLTTRYYEDSGLQPLCTYYYKISALNNSNIESALSQPIKAWTTYPLMIRRKVNGAVSGNYTFMSEANAVDFDLDGQKEVVVQATDNAKYKNSVSVVMKPDGSEPYDIDGNATTFSGYAAFNRRGEALPTVADIYGNGEMKLVSLTRDTEYQNWATCHSLYDLDDDKSPDIIWQTDIPKAAFRGAIITDIDIPDGKGEKEIIITGENNTITILNADGTTRCSFGQEINGFYHCPAVADIDGDGYKEIITGNGGALYVWNHDGSQYNRWPYFSRTGIDFRSSPVVCDLDNDGEKEIIIGARNENGYIFAIKKDGTCIDGFDGTDNSASITYPTGGSEGLDHAVSVGDINGDGNPEIVSLGFECVRAWNNNGELILNANIPGLFERDSWAPHLYQPILADVDGDSNIDIIFNENKKIYAIHSDGSEIIGFPLTTQEAMTNSVCVSDIDNDGNNEIISVDYSGNISIWKVKGQNIEWGRTRFDTGFTGEYIKGNKDPMVVTSDKNLTDEIISSDIYIRSGILNINKNTKMNNHCKIIVMDTGTLNINGCNITDANILVKSGGTLNIKNNGIIKLGRYSSLDSENGAIINIETGEVQ